MLCVGKTSNKEECSSNNGSNAKVKKCSLDVNLGVIFFLKMAHVLGVLTWVSIVYDITLSHEDNHMVPELKSDMYILICRTNRNLHVRISKLFS